MARLPGLVAGNVLDLGRAAASRLRPEETTAMDGRHAPPREDRGRRSEGGREKRQPATTDPAPSSEVFVAGRFTLRKRLRVSDNWVVTHAPEIQQRRWRASAHARCRARAPPSIGHRARAQRAALSRGGRGAPAARTHGSRTSPLLTPHSIPRRFATASRRRVESAHQRGNVAVRGSCDARKTASRALHRCRRAGCGRRRSFDAVGRRPGRGTTSAALCCKMPSSLTASGSSSMVCQLHTTVAGPLQLVGLAEKSTASARNRASAACGQIASAAVAGTAS